jgi:hypothetical protein
LRALLACVAAVKKISQSWEKCVDQKTEKRSPNARRLLNFVQNTLYEGIEQGSICLQFRIAVWEVVEDSSTYQLAEICEFQQYEDEKSLHEVCSSCIASSKEGPAKRSLNYEVKNSLEIHFPLIAVSRSFEKVKKRKSPSKIHKIRPESPRETQKVPN